MDYWANVDAVTWFASESFLRIRRASEGARFVIVGLGPPGKSTGSPRARAIEVTGSRRRRPAIPGARGPVRRAAASGARHPEQGPRGDGHGEAGGHHDRGAGRTRSATRSSSAAAIPRKEFAGAVLALLRSPEERRRIGTMGRAWVQTESRLGANPPARRGSRRERGDSWTRLRSRRFRASRADRIAKAPGATAWKLCLSALSLSLAAVLLVYFDTFRSMAAIWSRSDTYVHGYFVLPISLYLVWIRAEALRKMTPRADARAIVPIALAGVGWLAARLGGVLVAEQYFAVATVPLMVWAIAGPSVSRRILFPLCYLLLLVPVGEALIPHMIEYTAAFTVAALRVTGVPVLQEGNLLTLPNSQWSVVEACSGLRYLIACVTIGLVFAYLTYRSWTRRALFIALSIVVPIVANWVRAYLIVFIGYSSDMRFAVGVDHLIYGWIFYAFVMGILLWVGSRFSDETAPELRETRPAPAEVRPSPSYRTVYRCLRRRSGCGRLAGLGGFCGGSGLDDSVRSVAFAFPESVAEWNADR